MLFDDTDILFYFSSDHIEEIQTEPNLSEKIDQISFLGIFFALKNNYYLTNFKFYQKVK